MKNLQQHLYWLCSSFWGYHKIFSSIQKLAIFVGVVLFFAFFFGSSSAVLILVSSISCTVLSCHLLTSINRNYSGLRALLTFYKSFSSEIGSALSISRRLKNSIIALIWEDVDSKSTLSDIQQCNEAGSSGRRSEHDIKEKGNRRWISDPDVLDNVVRNNLEREINIFTELILQDFVRPWYCVREQTDDVIIESRMILREAMHELSHHLSGIDVYELARDILLCYHDHLTMFQIARTTYMTQPKRRRSIMPKDMPSKVANFAARKMNSVEEAFEKKFSYHSAVWGIESELNYVKSLTQLLLIRLLGNHIQPCKTSKTLLVEILSCNVLVPVIELLANADFLHETIVRILSDEELVKVDDFENKTKSENLHNENKSAQADEFSYNGSSITIKQKNENYSMEQVESHQGKSQAITKSQCGERKGDMNQDIKEQGIEDIQQSNTDGASQKENNNSSDEQVLHSHSISFTSDLTFSEVPVSLLSPAVKRSFVQDKPGDVHKSSITDDTSSQEVEQRQKSHSAPKNRTSSQTKETREKSNSEPRDAKSNREKKSAMKAEPGIELGEDAGAKCPDKNDVENSMQVSKDINSKVDFGLSSNSYEDIAEEKVQDCLEQTFQEVNIIGTEITNESRSSSQYTLYVIEYTAWYITEDDLRTLRTQTVKRRFREFENLQSRLEDIPFYRASLRDTKGPKRWISLPFGNMDKSTVDNRKNRLEAYIKALILKPDVGNGPELKEFLGYEGDGHIAFVKKAPEVSLQGINKALIRTMSEVFDKIGGKMDQITTKASEVLPSFPGKKETSTWDPSIQYEKDDDHIPLEFGFLKESLKYPIEGVLVKSIEKLDHQAESDNQAKVKDDKRTAEPTAFQQSDVVGKSQEPDKAVEEKNGNETESALEGCKAVESAIQNEDDDFYDLDPEKPEECKPMEQISGPEPGSIHIPQTHSVTKSNVNQSTDSEVPSQNSAEASVKRKDKLGDRESFLAEAVFDVAVQALQGRDCWLCRERVVSLTKHITATALHRWLEMEIDDLKSEKMCLYYIRNLREVIWPGGLYESPGRGEKSLKQKDATKAQAQRVLADFFPNFVRGLIDQEDYYAAIDEVMDSIQYEKLNKNFIYTVLDLVIERAFPEISINDLQKELCT